MEETRSLRTNLSEVCGAITALHVLSILLFPAGALTCRIHAQRAYPLQEEQESLWVALVNMHKTDTNKTLQQTSRYPQDFLSSQRGAAGCSREVLWISRSLVQCFVGVCFVHIHQCYPEALQCRAHVLNTLYWLASHTLQQHIA